MLTLVRNVDLGNLVFFGEGTGTNPTVHKCIVNAGGESSKGLTRQRLVAIPFPPTVSTPLLLTTWAFQDRYVPVGG